MRNGCHKTPKLEHGQLKRLDFVLNQLIEVHPQAALDALDLLCAYLKPPAEPNAKKRKRYWHYSGPRLNLGKFLHFQGVATIELLRKHQVAPQYLNFAKYRGGLRPELLGQLHALGLLGETETADLQQTPSSSSVPDLPVDVPSLQAQLLQLAPDALGASEMLTLLLQRDRQAFGEFVPELLADNPLWLEQSTLLHYLERQRPALLLQCLQSYPLDRLKHVLFAGHFATWTARQQAQLKQILAQGIA